MANKDDPELKERLEHLERRVARLEEALSGSRLERPAAVPAPAAPSAPVPHLARFRGGENLLNRLGIALFLLGLAFLFKYSIDQGWLTNPVKVGFGLVSGCALGWLGWRLLPRRPAPGQVLLGGGIAALYLTGFAAFQLYSLVPYLVDLTFMIALTSVALLISVRRRLPVPALIGAAGGFGTPFMLYTGSGSVQALVVYSAVILSGVALIFLFRGWQALLWTAFLGYWIALFVGYLRGNWTLLGLGSGERGALLAGIGFGLAVFWALPLLRQRLRPFGNHLVMLHVLAVLNPFVALLLAMQAVTLSDRAWGFIALAGAGVLAACCVALARTSRMNRLAYGQGAAVLPILNLGLFLLLEGDALLVAAAFQMLALHFLSNRLGDTGCALAGHFFLVLLVWVQLIRLADFQAGHPPVFFNPRALADVAAILLVLATSLILKQPAGAWCYRFWAHFAFLFWLARECFPLSNGAGWTTILWVLYSLGLIVFGLKIGSVTVRVAGFGTLLLSVLKLLLVDMAQVDALWRVLLFLGIGTLSLLLSYYWKNLGKAGS